MDRKAHKHCDPTRLYTRPDEALVLHNKSFSVFNVPVEDMLCWFKRIVAMPRLEFRDSTMCLYCSIGLEICSGAISGSMKPAVLRVSGNSNSGVTEL